MSCCPPKKEQANDPCHPKNKFDYLLWGSLSLIILGCLFHLTDFYPFPQYTKHLSHSFFNLIQKMWWGILFGAIAVGILSYIPREVIIAGLGRKRGFNGIIRATLLGLALDLCNHGILLVGMKFYERGASLGQTMAFLIASPWNSFSLTIILVALVGLKWTLLFVILSAAIAVLSGMLFEILVNKKILSDNPNSIELPENYSAIGGLKKVYSDVNFNGKFFKTVFTQGFVDSRPILRWLFFGVVLAGLIEAFVSTEHLQEYFGPSLLGLALTLVATTVIEVCSEGSTPIAADLLNRASAPGNAFTFLMAGVSTDYTEIMALKETTRSWKISLFLPLITVPQILVISWILNQT